MATIVKWPGKSGITYDSEAFPFGTVFNKVSGVYIVSRKILSGSHEALYVGETESLFDRLNAGEKTHEGIARVRQYGITHICVVRVTGNSERLRVETDLRHGLNPVGNAQRVPGGWL